MGNSIISRTSQPFIVDRLDTTARAKGLERCPLSGTVDPSFGGYDEAWVQNLIAAHPEILPIAAIEPAFAGAKSVCMELRTPAGYIDNVLATDRGDLVLVECKLWRNPQARREVLGQIIDYAKDLARWNFEQLDHAVRRAVAPPGATQTESLVERISSPDGLDEPSLVDAISQNLRRGRFLLLIVGDGIREDVEALASFLQQHAGLHFTLALVELAVFKLPDTDSYLVYPAVVMRTTMIERGVVRLTDDRLEILPSAQTSAEGAYSAKTATRIASTITEEKLFELLDRFRHGAADRFKSFLSRASELGVTTELLSGSVKLVGRIEDDLWPLGTIQAKDGTVWFDSVIGTASNEGLRERAFEYYRELAELIDDASLRAKKIDPRTVSGLSSLPLSSLLDHDDKWLLAIEAYMRDISRRKQF